MKIMIPLLFFSIVVLVSASCSDNGVGPIESLDSTWTYLGLGNESITAIAIDPTNPDIIFAGSMSNFSAGTPGRLFKTTNAGASWDTLLAGLSDKYTAVLIDPKDPRTIYAAPWGLIKSQDGGKTWNESDNGILLDWETHVGAIKIDPNNSNILYAGTGGTFGGNIYKSTDAGSSWVTINDSTGGSVTSIAVDPINNNILYIGMAGVWPLLKTIDGGSHWTQSMIPEGFVKDVIVDPSNSSRIFAGLTWINGVSGNGIWKSDNGGDDWASFNGGLPDSSGVTKIVEQARRGNMYVAVSANTLSSTGVYARQVSNGMWTQIGANSDEVRISGGDLQLGPDGRYLYSGGTGIFRLEVE